MFSLVKFLLVLSLIVVSVSAASFQSLDDEKDVPVPENLDMMSAMLESIIGSKDIMQIPDADPEGLDNLKERCIFGTRVCNLHCVAKGKRYGRCVHGRCVCY
ncbi:uncharacterized protein LOC111055944 isoform X1 [Nilaparvata lugens]|uniref:uncharacterized protein LOC111055944 isoform X1 n=1 Tax=Nilaparvata lugens TaxID=108931 RepID=UPI000B98C516|nr:uncharacterized protein LOC111055944 isoform X1 [Nilaparvata lugens]